MKKLASVAFAVGAILGTAGAASAQGIYFGVDPGYQQYYGPGPYYRERQYYGEPQYYYDDRRYRRGRYRSACAPGWSVQDGVCKPYRGY